MPKGIPLTEEEQNRRRKEIFNASVHLFLEKGFTETSMREIADAAGIGKSTLYYYFKSKDEILISYFINEISKITVHAEEIVEQNLSIAEKLRNIMRMHLTYLTANKKVFLKLTTETQRLSLESQEKIQVKRHAYQDLLQSLIEEGIQTGEFRSVNPLFAARSISTLLSLAIFTSRPTGTPEEMMADALDIFFKGVEI